MEARLDEEMSEHLGGDKSAPEGRKRRNSRKGKAAKTVVTGNAGPVQIVVPREREGPFEPVIVPKRAEAILREEVAGTLALLGVAAVADLRRDHVRLRST